MKKLFAALLLTGFVMYAAGLILPAFAADAENDRLVYVVEIKGVISPVTTSIITQNIATAAQAHADALVLEMHTPGGLYDATQDIIQAIIDSPVPVITYVYPPGSHAASAGTYIMYGSHLAVMAPSTNLGAATPIQLQRDGTVKPELTTLDHKMINDAAAYIRGLAEMRARNAEWAEKAVRDADSLSASEALSKKVIDFMAEDIETLLLKADGREVKMAHGKTQKLHTKGARIEYVKTNVLQTILQVITDPNIAMLLISLGSAGLIYEIAHPGVLFPGVAGAICLLLGLYAMKLMPISYSALGMIFLGMGLMAGEAFAPAFGMLGISGAISFILGAIMLSESDIPGMRVDYSTIAAMTIFCLVFLTLILSAVWRARRKPKVTGQEELLTAEAFIVSWSGNKGEVRVTGEIWSAVSSGDYIIKTGDQVRVTAIEGLVLTVIPVSAS